MSWSLVQYIHHQRGAGLELLYRYHAISIWGVYSVLVYSTLLWLRCWKSRLLTTADQEPGSKPVPDISRRCFSLRRRIHTQVSTQLQFDHVVVNISHAWLYLLWSCYYSNIKAEWHCPLSPTSLPPSVSQQRQVKIPSSIKIAVNTFTNAFLNIKWQCSSRAKMIESQFIRLMKSFSSQNPLCLKILSSKSTADAESSRALQRI